MSSDRYKALKKQVGQLARSLLPRDLKADLLDLTPRLSVRALSFRVLAHAEIESYLEDRVLEVVRACGESFKTRRHVSITTLSLLGFSGANMTFPPISATAPVNKKDKDWSQLTKLDHRVAKSISAHYHNASNENHGIKEANILSLLLPIGVPIAAIDQALLVELNNFGSQRGEAAHSSTLGQVRVGVNPIDEYNRVMRILGDLNTIDGEISRAFVAAK